MSVEVYPNLMDIHRSFSDTELGMRLAGQVRFDRYKPDDVSNEQWVKLLGANVNNLTHLPLTWGLTKDLVSQFRQQQPDFLDAREEQVLQAAALIHDWAEAVVGDITYSDKTDEDEAEEKNQLVAILARFDDSSTNGLHELIDEAAAGVVFSPESKLGHIFNTVERVGYMRTAIRASKHVIAGDTPDCDAGFRWIVADVFGNHPSVLVERAEVYKPVGNYLINQLESITQSFGIVYPEVFSNYPLEQQVPKHDAFYRSHEFWSDWAAIQPAG